MTEDSVTEGTLDALAKTRPWVRFLSILSFIALALALAGAVIVAAWAILQMTDGRRNTLALVALPALYLMFALLCIGPVLSLSRYARAINVAVTSPEKTAAIEDALRQQKSFWKRSGMIVLLMLAVLCVGGPAVAIPNYRDASERAKIKRSMASIREVGTTVEAYATDKNEYPKVATIDELAGIVEPKYNRTLPRTDGWGRKLVYMTEKCEGGHCQSYVVASPGRDGRMDRPLSQYPRDKVIYTEGYDNDIVYSDGNFVQCLEPRSGGD